MSLVLTSPYEIFADTAGKPLEGGYLYIGTANLNAQSNPITVYWDSALTIPAAQPIRTSGGYPTLNGAARNVYIPGAYSIMVKDKNQKLVFSAANPAADLGSGILTLLKTVDGSGSGLIAEGLQSIEITDLDFDPTLLGLADREVRSYSTSFGPANQPSNSGVDYFNLTLTKVNATSYILSAFGRDLSNVPTGAQFTRYWTGGAWGSWRWFVDEYDFVVDSNQALDQWIAHTGGLYKRVLVKAGTWTASTLGATAGVLLDLDTSGTTYVFAERGSNIVYSGGFAGTILGLRHAVAPTDTTAEHFQGLKITLTNTTATRGATAFSGIVNLIDCYGSGTGSTTGNGAGIAACSKMYNCTGIGTGGNTTGIGTGISVCTNLVNCVGTGAGNGTNGSGSGIDGCSIMSNCTGTGTGTGTGVGSGIGNGNRATLCNGIGAVSGTGTAWGIVGVSKCVGCTGTATNTSGLAYGMETCSQSTNCEGSGTTTAGASAAVGLRGCVGVVNCRGVGTSFGGAGYAFQNCTKMQQNRTTGVASTTATYNNSFADAAAANPCADTAAGGFNS